MLVTFDNIEDANSVREVDRNALDRTPGPGYGPVAMTLTDTSERATQGTLAKKFPALHAAMTAPRSPPPPAKPAWQREREKKERDAAGDIPPTPQKPDAVRHNVLRIDWGPLPSQGPKPRRMGRAKRNSSFIRRGCTMMGFATLYPSYWTLARTPRVGFELREAPRR
ncbi:hypothetical protein QA645_37670 [Bradyrhizobium sp. CIAT3101]|uniref:hypothetical protein n=1 Tax=Bradyrhizobium sp. CIAT3101 TaxID=439387 RepID=UPI0024B1A080|nr:hypothetical protein [Bradyrhizobium sp. CIAT3101]WFU80169.1 hypothetical protein QA645_37670 [Bradyrhizobium sp. CIAT3101]